MILKGYEAAVNVAVSGATGIGPLDHAVSSGPVSRLPAIQNLIFLDNFNKNLNVPLMDSLGARKANCDPKSHYQNFEIENFRFSQTCS